MAGWPDDGLQLPRTGRKRSAGYGGDRFTTRADPDPAGERLIVTDKRAEHCAAAALDIALHFHVIYLLSLAGHVQR